MEHAQILRYQEYRLLIDTMVSMKNYDILLYKARRYIIRICTYVQRGPKVSTHTLGLIPPPCFIFDGCCFADGILYLLVRGFRH